MHLVYQTSPTRVTHIEGSYKLSCYESSFLQNITG
jgi:hypothetical protein